MDLKHAYKQLARSPAHAFATVIAVYNPRSGTCELFIKDTFAFGQVAAVNGFCRTGIAIAKVNTRLFKFLLSSYVDDYTQVELGTLAQSAAATFERGTELNRVSGNAVRSTGDYAED